MKLGAYRFNLQELAGATGDYGTLLPLAIGYIVVCGLDPTGFLVMMGIATIITGIYFKLPMPIEPMKALAVFAIASSWSPSLIYASGIGMGIIWLFIGATGLMTWFSKITPKSVVQGIQASLALLLAIEALKFIQGEWILAIVSIIIILILRNNKYAPAAIILLLMGIIIMFFQGTLLSVGGPHLTLPHPVTFSLNDVWESVVAVGFAQIPLTATNAVIATAYLIKEYFPERTVPEKKIALNIGIMNITLPFFGGMPLCHGAGGLAGQYFFGARTGGANIMEGLIYIILGLFFAGSIVVLFKEFPSAIIGAMMVMISIGLLKFTKDLKADVSIIPIVITVIGSILLNMAVGFIAGLISYYILKRANVNL
ncbi:MAG: putative sulfate/molybdate transporter [Methanobacterium sp.]